MLMLQHIWMFLATVILMGTAHAGAVFSTSSYRFELLKPCKEGDVSCSNMEFSMKQHKTGLVKTLKGGTMHAPCKDGVTPCRFLGYKLKDGKTDYLLFDTGELVVKQGKKTLDTEAGSWVH